jgi:hypothetical protein
MNNPFTTKGWIQDHKDKFQGLKGDELLEKIAAREVYWGIIFMAVVLCEVVFISAVAIGLANLSVHYIEQTRLLTLQQELDYQMICEDTTDSSYIRVVDGPKYGREIICGTGSVFIDRAYLAPTED